MRELIFYDPLAVTQDTNLNVPGMRMFSNYFKIYNAKVVPVDRTDTIHLPIRVKSLYPMPEFRPFTKTYEQICDERARELLAHAESLNLAIHVFWSGGIDSTLVLVSLLKHATPTQRQNITVLLTEESIAENSRFYNEHIRGNLATDSSAMFPYLLGGDYLIVNGEHNDQIFGSDAVGNLIQTAGPGVIHQSYSRDLFHAFFDAKLNDYSATNTYLNLFEKLTAASPVSIDTNYQFLWWINFALKWQTVSLRMLPYVAERNVPKITHEYVESHFIPFYRTEDFQLWSMHNPDKKIKDSWSSYKFTAKDIIYDFTKDADYRDTKAKKGSLHGLLLQQTAYDFIDSDWNFYRTMDPMDYCNPENDFV